MNRPEIICHMLSTLDGKIAGMSFAEAAMEPYFSAYGRIRKELEAEATVYGATTAKEIFVGKDKPVFSGNQTIKSPSDYICRKKADYYVVTIDPLGEVDWSSRKGNTRPGLENAHFVVVTSLEASEEYLNMLRNEGISYVISSGKNFGLQDPMKKLKAIFRINRVLLQGGGIVNGLFAREKLIDKISLIMAPFADCSSTASTTFETGSFLPTPIKPLEFEIEKTERIDPNGLWVYFTKN